MWNSNPFVRRVAILGPPERPIIITQCDPSNTRVNNGTKFTGIRNRSHHCKDPYMCLWKCLLYSINSSQGCGAACDYFIHQHDPQGRRWHRRLNCHRLVMLEGISVCSRARMRCRDWELSPQALNRLPQTQRLHRNCYFTRHPERILILLRTSRYGNQPRILIEKVRKWNIRKVVFYLVDNPFGKRRLCLCCSIFLEFSFYGFGFVMIILRTPRSIRQIRAKFN